MKRIGRGLNATRALSWKEYLQGNSLTHTVIQQHEHKDLLFADDCALNASSEPEMQQSMNKFSSACDSFGLTISTKKTEVMFQPAPRKAFTEPSITVKGVTLKVVESFAYLGSILSRSVHIDNEVDARIAKASTAFGRIRKKVWESNGQTTRTKLKVYKAAVLPSLLYSCETWTVYSSHTNMLNCFHLDCLRKLLRVKWQDKIPDTEVLRLTDLPSIHTILGKNQLLWSGHVSRMDDYRFPKRLFLLRTFRRKTLSRWPI